MRIHSMDDKKLGDTIVRMFTAMKYGHLERRCCTAGSPMAEADKDKFMWGHPDAKAIEPFFNLVRYECPHCKLSFNASPRETE